MKTINQNKLLANIEAEEEFLGTVRFDPKIIGLIASQLPADAFSLSAHQKIYEFALEIYRQNKPTDLTTISTWLQDHNLLDSVGGTLKLTQLLDSTVTSKTAQHYVELVMNKYQRRLLRQTGQEIVELASDTSANLETVFDSSEQKLFDITTKKTRGKI